MRYWIPLLLLISFGGVAQGSIAQDVERLRELPDNSSALQLQGRTYYRSGDTYYQYSPQGNYYYEVAPPSAMRQIDNQPSYHARYRTPEAQASMQERTIVSPEAGQAAQCRNYAAARAEGHSNGGRIYSEAFDRCMSVPR